MTINDVFRRFQRMPAIESTNGRYEIETAETVNFKFKKMQIRAVLTTAFTWRHDIGELANQWSNRTAERHHANCFVLNTRLPGIKRPPLQCSSQNTLQHAK